MKVTNNCPSVRKMSVFVRFCKDGQHKHFSVLKTEMVKSNPCLIRRLALWRFSRTKTQWWQVETEVLKTSPHRIWWSPPPLPHSPPRLFAFRLEQLTSFKHCHPPQASSVAEFFCLLHLVCRSWTDQTCVSAAGLFTLTQPGTHKHCSLFNIWLFFSPPSSSFHLDHRFLLPPLSLLILTLGQPSQLFALQKFCLEDV